MRKLIIAGFMIISLLQIECNAKKIEPISVIEACKVAIDATFSIDKALNDGDTLFLKLPKELNLNENDKFKILNSAKEKYEMKFIVSLYNYQTIREKLTPEHPNLKNFIIGVSKIQYKNRKTVVVESFKYVGMLGAVYVETVFEYIEDHWICNGSKITSMS